MKEDNSLYRQIRAGFALQGTSMCRWCRENDISKQWAQQCLVGKRKGQAAKEMISRIAKAAGVEYDYQHE